MAAALVGGAFLGAFFNVLIDRLASPEVVDFFKGRKPNTKLLEELKMTMRSVGELLGDAEEKQITKYRVREWLDNLKDAFYKADDLLDKIAYAALSSELEAGPQNNIRFRTFIHFPLEEIESQLMEIHEKLQKLVYQKNDLGLKEGIGEKPPSQRPQTTSLMDESDFYGRDKDKRDIIQLLLSDDTNCNKLGLIPIIGMGGVGKTTLAKSVYNDSIVKERFRSKAWIYVSEEFNVLNLTVSILNAVSKKTHQFNSLDLYQVALKKELSHKTFLLVLDDVWNENEDHWESLLMPLKAGPQGSKIIITTRHAKVATVTSSLPFLNVENHYLDKLSDGDCWSLFSKRAFDGRSSGASAALEKIGREIVRKCDGLPLAAKSLGGLLRTTEDPAKWRSVLKNNIWKTEDKIIPALRLSYHFLPSDLKQCFAYCAIFPKGYRFIKKELALLWMGEGFLAQASKERSGEDIGKEDIGKEYFDNLVSRSFFNPNGDRFIMHDLINDLARFVAGDFCSRLDDGDDSCEVPPRTRHLRYVRTTNLWSNISERIFASAPLLRTFLLDDDGKESQVIYDTHDTHALLKFERLRVLSLSRWSARGHAWHAWHARYIGDPMKLMLDDSIGNLNYLRYLNLSSTSFEFLPKSLCSLYHLEILLLRYCSRLDELPLNLGKLTNLCVLDIEGTYLQKMPPQMGKLKKLQKLSHFVIGEESKSSIPELGNLAQSESRIQELGDLEQLRGCLVIWNLRNVKYVGEASSANIKGKTHLKELKLVWNRVVEDPLEDDGVAYDPQGDDDPEHDISLLEQLKPHENLESLTIIGYGGIKFPNWNDGYLLLGVVTLKLEGCRHCCQLPPLGQLVHLKRLFLRDFPNIVVIGAEFYGICTSTKKPFQCLEVLRFENMPQWQEWVMCGNEEEVFHLLQELYIIKCPAFKQSLPQHLPSLITLEIRESERFVASLPTIPRILKMNLKDLNLSDGRLSVIGSLLERIELLGCCGFFNTLREVSISWCDFLKCFSLEPFSNLKDLRIYRCLNLAMINGNCISLLSLEIQRCPKLVSFPEVGLKTPNLQRLQLWNCSNLKWLSESMHSLLYSLEELTIWDCPMLELFPEGGLPLKLHRLEIDGCTKLNGRNKWNFDYLPSLLYLKISNCEHAECFPEESLLPPTLTSFEIAKFSNLKSLEYKGIEHLTSLQHLSIVYCPEFRLLPKEGLPSSLTSLDLGHLQNLESVVNSKIQQLSNLKELSIESCPRLKSVPEEGLPSTITSLKIQNLFDLESLNSRGLQNLTSLKRLIITDCPKLQSLPEEGLPSSLFSLIIERCFLLWRRYNQEKGEDWPKISHISEIKISFN